MPFNATYSLESHYSRTMSASRIRIDYSKETEASVNQLISFLFQHQYEYVAMQNFFLRDEVALKGVRKFIGCKKHCTLRTLEALMEMQIQVGGQVMYPTIKPPTKVQYANIEEVLKETMEMEKKINQLFIEVHSVATKNNDPQVMLVLKELLQKSVETVKDVSEQITIFERCEGKMGDFLFDRYILKEMLIRKANWEAERIMNTPNHCHCFPSTPNTPEVWSSNLTKTDFLHQ